MAEINRSGSAEALEHWKIGILNSGTVRLQRGQK
jgi:hypothetical protein